MDGRRNEEILLSVDNVELKPNKGKDEKKQKKMEGTLYMMNERIAWMQKNSDSFLFSQNYGDIKVHKISAEGKAKVQLQLVMNDDSASTFRFISPQGVDNQIKDRDKVKDLLSRLLPQFRQKMSKDLEQKKSALLDNPNLFQLYNDLVVSSIVTADDFWTYYADPAKLKAGQPSLEIGVSQGFLSNICPKSDGSQGITYNITYDDIKSIFRTYPHVREKYLQNVPHKMTEKDFWTKFFQSHYFHRDRLANSSTDLFAECARKDDDDLKQNSEASTTVVNMDQSQPNVILEEGYGLHESRNNSNISNQNLIKRYNYYSMRILNSMEENAHGSISAGKGLRSRTSMKMDEKLDDLDSTLMQTNGRPLKLTKVNRYFDGPIAMDFDSLEINNLSESDFYELYRCKTSELNNWKLNLKSNVNSNAALNILKELSPSGELMNGSTVQNLNDVIPKVHQDEMKGLYVSVCELLRHFWSCFPPTTPELEHKFDIMKETLESFQQNKIAAFKDRLYRDDSTYHLTSHLENLISVAVSKYNKWKMRQR